MSKPERLTVWHADLVWDDYEIVVKASDYEALEAARAADKALIAELTEALKSAREMVADWGAYASEYFREKHGLDRDIAELDAVIAQQGKEGGE